MHTIQSVFPIRRHVLGVFLTGGASLSADGLWNTAAATAMKWGAPEP